MRSTSDRYAWGRATAWVFRARSPRQRGLTLIEIIIGLAILLIALVALYGVITQAIRSFGVHEDVLEIQENARVGVDKLSEEARWTRHVVVATADCPSPDLDPKCVSLQIENNPLRPGPYMVSFKWDDVTKKLIRTEAGGGTAVPFAEYVTDFSFAYLDENGNTTVAPNAVVRLAVTITATKGIGPTKRVVVGDVFLRNAPATPGSPAPTLTRTLRETLTPTETPTQTPTETGTPTPTCTLPNCPTPTLPPTEPHTPTPTFTSPPTASPARTRTPTLTPSLTIPPTATATPTATPTPPPTQTPTPTPTQTIPC